MVLKKGYLVLTFIYSSVTYGLDLMDFVGKKALCVTIKNFLGYQLSVQNLDCLVRLVAWLQNQCVVDI